MELRSDSELASYLRAISLARFRREPEPPACNERPVVTVDSSAPAVGEALVRGRVHESTNVNGVGIDGAQLFVASLMRTARR